MNGGMRRRLGIAAVTLAFSTAARAQYPSEDGIDHFSSGDSPNTSGRTGTQGGQGNPNCPPPVMPGGIVPKNWSCPTGTDLLPGGRAHTTGVARCNGAEPGTYVLPSAVANRLYRSGVWRRCTWCPGDRFVCWPNPGAEPLIAKALGDARPPPPRQPPAPSGSPGGDPFLAGMSAAFQQCGNASREMLKLPLLLLTGNFFEAAHLLGVQPGQSIVLRGLVQELNQPILGPQQPFEAGARIGSRICNFGLAIPAMRKAGRPPRGAPAPRRPHEPAFKRRPSPTSFQGKRPDRVSRHTFPDPGQGWTAELAGEAGMAAEAAARGYWVLLPPAKLGSAKRSLYRHGPDGIYWDPKGGAIVVGEAKGGYNRLPLDDILESAYAKQRGGVPARQGTLDWLEAASKKIATARRTSDWEVRYAEQILARALRDRKVPIRVEVFHTDFENGRPGVTRYYVTDSLPAIE